MVSRPAQGALCDSTASTHQGATSTTASAAAIATTGPPLATARAAASLWGSRPCASNRVSGLMRPAPLPPPPVPSSARTWWGSSSRSSRAVRGIGPRLRRQPTGGMMMMLSRLCLFCGC